VSELQQFFAILIKVKLCYRISFISPFIWPEKTAQLLAGNNRHR